MKASDLFVRCLEEEGVRFVFGLPGEENLDLLESIRRSESIEFVVTRHEQHAAFMAATYGRLTGRAGVCLSTLGPGATNLLTGIAQAQLGGMPLVAITGQKPIVGNVEGKFQLIDVVSTFAPLTKWNASIRAGAHVARNVRHAFHVAEAERRGAVHLELPEDVARAEVSDERPHTRIPQARTVADEETLDRCADFVRGGKTAVVIAGSDANRPGVATALARFAERSRLHVVTTQMGKGCIPEDHELSLSCLAVHQRDYVHAAIEAADVVITVGYDIVEYPPSVWNERRDKCILHVGYTHAEADEYYAPAQELLGDLAQTLDRLGERLEGRAPAERRFAALRTLIDDRLASAGDAPSSPSRIVKAVRGALGRDDVVCLDNGLYKLWFARNYRAYGPNTLLLDNALATMGAGLATAMATKLVHPDRRVVAVCGDGGFLMNSQDLETAVRLGMSVVILVLRDDAYGFIRHKQRDDGFPDYAMAFGNPDFVRYAEAYGARGLRVGEDLALEEALGRALSEDGPALVECPVDYGERFEPTDGDRRRIAEIMS